MKYRVHFISMTTGSTGHGSPISHDNAVKAAKLGNELYSNLNHWIEPVRELRLVK